jgi:signal peptidase I
MMCEIIEFIKDMFKYLVVIAIIILVRIYVLTTAEVIGTSMEPNYNDGNIMMVEQVSSRFGEYKRFNVVVIKYSNPRYLIKRVIGLPGETIKYIDNKLYINGELIDEPFNTIGDTEDLEYIVPENSYYVLGDNRGDSKDSRYFGSITQKDIIGKPLITIWPLNRIKTIN